MTPRLGDRVPRPAGATNEGGFGVGSGFRVQGLGFRVYRV